MTGDDALLERVARAVLDGTPLEWESDELRDLAATRPEIEELRLLAGIAAIRDAAGEPASPGSCRARPPQRRGGDQT